jgi:hypothetical protein
MSNQQHSFEFETIDDLSAVLGGHGDGGCGIGCLVRRGAEAGATAGFRPVQPQRFVKPRTAQADF